MEEERVIVSAGRSDDFWKATWALSNYISELPISNDQNNKFIDLLCKNIHTAERDAFNLGVTIGAQAAAFAAKEKREPLESDYLAALDNAKAWRKDNGKQGSDGC